MKKIIKCEKCGKDANLIGVDDRGYKYHCPECYSISHDAGVAQMAELVTCNDPVRGSNPCIGPKYYKKIKSVNKDEHIIIMEEYLGRPLEKDEIVHHVDEIKSHNDIENLELCLKSVHSRYHYDKGDMFDIAKWNKEYNTKPDNHGTRTQYEKYGCRCDLCKEAKRKHNKQRYKKGNSRNR